MENAMENKKHMYTQNQLVKLAKRENNNKRKYLIVNQLQGKHIPVKPSLALNMFFELGHDIRRKYKNERLLLVGFAETATAIGSAVATLLKCNYIQTTREAIYGVQYLFFSEEHSHATEQKLVKDDIDEIIGKTDRIIFIEDEVTTGNTIFNIINLLKEVYNNHVKFSVVSILNGMNLEAELACKKKEIDLHYLVKTNHEKYENTVDDIKENNNYHKPRLEDMGLEYTEIVANKYLDARRLINGGDYDSACNNLYKQIADKIQFNKYSKILVLGTEEFMYPGLFVAGKIENLRIDVKFHATTRSPICVSDEAGYPFKKRNQLISLYDDERTTFVYDLDKYDCVIVVTDSLNKSTRGLNSLLSALKDSGNNTFFLVRWCQI